MTMTDTTDFCSASMIIYDVSVAAPVETLNGKGALYLVEGMITGVR